MARLLLRRTLTGIRTSASVASLLLLTGAASAQSTGNKATAVASYDDAEKLMAEGQYKAACAKYAESYRLDPALGALVHLADCQEKADLIASAWATWRDVAEFAAKKGDEREAYAKQQIAKLEPTLPRLTIEVPDAVRVPGLEVRRDGVLVGEALWGSAVPVDAGTHAIVATAPGKKQIEASVEIKGAGTAETFTLTALADAPTESVGGAGPAPVGGGPDVASGTDSSAGGTQRVLGWTAVGAGVLGLGVGLIFELKRADKVSTRDDVCPNRSCPGATQAERSANGARYKTLEEEAKDANTIALIGAITGGVLVAGGLTLVLTAPSGRSSARLRTTPVFAPGFAGIDVRAAF